MTPFDVVKDLKPLYAPSAKHPSIVEVPDLAFLMLDGRGDPATSEAYVEALEALYGVAYTLKFTLKKADPERDFKVAPLEGLWWGDEEKPSLASLQDDRDAWNWTMMIAVPDAVTAAELDAAAVAAARKRPGPRPDASAWSASPRASRRRSCTWAPTPTRRRRSRGSTPSRPRRATSCAAVTTRSTSATRAARRRSASKQ